MFLLSKAKAFLRPYDPLTLKRIETIERKPLGPEENMDKIQSVQNRDFPKERRPWNRFFWYRYMAGCYIISNWNRQVIINCIVDNQCYHQGKTVPLHFETPEMEVRALVKQWDEAMHRENQELADRVRDLIHFHGYEIQKGEDMKSKFIPLLK